MNPVTFPQANSALLPPRGSSDVVALPCYRNGEVVVSCWELSDEEIWDLIKTRRIYLMVVGGTHPPLALFAKPPFI